MAATAPWCVWNGLAVEAILEDSTDASRLAEQVSVLVEGLVDFMLVQRTVRGGPFDPPRSRTGLRASRRMDPIRLPARWRPGLTITTVTAGDDTLEYDVDTARGLLYRRGEWPEVRTEDDRLIPNINVTARAGVLTTQLGPEGVTAASAVRYADLFAAGEEILRGTWARRESGPAGVSAEQLAMGGDVVRWSNSWPRHVNEAIRRHRVIGVG